MFVIQATESLRVQLAAAQDEIGRLQSQLAEAQQLSQSQQQQVTASNEDLVSSQKQVVQLNQQVAELGQVNESLSTHNLQLREVLLEAYALPNQLEISEARLEVSQWQVTQLNEQMSQLQSQLQSQQHAVGTRRVDAWGRDVEMKKLRQAAQHEAAMMRALDASLPSLAPPPKPSPALTKQLPQLQAQLHYTHSALEEQRQEGVRVKLGLQEKVSAANDETAALRAQLEEMQAAPPLKRTPLKRTPLKRTPLGQLQADMLTPKLLHPVSSLKLQNVLWCSCLFPCKFDSEYMCLQLCL